MAANNLTDALLDSHVATVGGLNTVYHYLLSRIKKLDENTSYIFSPKGTKACVFSKGNGDSLEELTEARCGDIYNVTEEVIDGITIKNQNFLCIKSFVKINGIYAKYTYTLTEDSSSVSGKSYFKYVSGTKDSDYAIYEVYENPSNPKKLGLYERTITNYTEISSFSSNWTELWDDFGGTYGIPSSSVYGVVKTSADANTHIISNGILADTDDTTITVNTNNKLEVKLGANVTTDSNGIAIESLELTKADGPAIVVNGPKNRDNTVPTATNCALKVDGNIYADGNISGYKVFHAVWNDISDAIEVQDDLEIEPGFCYMFDGITYKKTEEYCQKGVLGIHSDTAGDILGRKGKHKELDIAIGGFVLAHVDDIYESGTPLTCGPDGCLTEMKREDVREYPERLVGTYWKPEPEDFWGSENGKIPVNGRQWIKIK